jgi:hypothetical protein
MGRWYVPSIIPGRIHTNTSVGTTYGDQREASIHDGSLSMIIWLLRTVKAIPFK